MVTRCCCRAVNKYPGHLDDPHIVMLHWFLDLDDLGRVNRA